MICPEVVIISDKHCNHIKLINIIEVNIFFLRLRYYNEMMYNETGGPPPQVNNTCGDEDILQTEENVCETGEVLHLIN